MKLVKLLVTGSTFNGVVKSEFPDAYVLADSVTVAINPANAVALIFAGSMVHQVLFTQTTFATDVIAYRDDFITRANA